MKGVVKDELETNENICPNKHIGKAFDNVNRRKIWEILKEKQVNNKLLAVTKSLYKNRENIVITKNRHSETFKAERGLRQGGGLGPLLFIVYMDQMIREARKETKPMMVGYTNMERIENTEHVFADDILLTASSERELQHNLNIWNMAIRTPGSTTGGGRRSVPPGFQFSAGAPFSVAIRKADDHFSVWVDGQLAGEFKFRDGHSNVDTLYVHGDVIVKSVYMRQKIDDKYFNRSQENVRPTSL
ncbi:hypothetical protein NQ318_004521 [Aromia moschata]|uniref:Galectin n=1 Tax=Aromia moschata TaxID=1265417 RepID=A0AAV8Y501_9CUCU|nr:hypothetical protein NQ318_004521 [Aromia moschata]